MKGLLIALQYHHKAAGRPARAAERRIDSDAQPWSGRRRHGARRADLRRHSGQPRRLAARPKAWKEALIAAIDRAARLRRRAAAAAVGMGAGSTPATDEFRRVTFSAEFIPDQEALVYTPARRCGPTSTGRATGCSRRRGFPAAASSWSTAASCRWTGKELGDAAPASRRRRRYRRRAALAGRARRCSRRRDDAETISGSPRDHCRDGHAPRECRRAILRRSGSAGAARRLPQPGKL